MKTVGLITEYNPFHSGHLYHIKQAKSLSGADYAIAVMSGDYVQRGVPAILDKYTRTRMALLGGADLVLELPLPYATASAAGFAFGAVSLLDALQVVDTLCFGSESGEIEPLLALSHLLLEETTAYQLQLRTFLKKGFSYPMARRKTLTLSLGEEKASLLDSPNNILGLAYCQAILRGNSSIRPFTIARIGEGHHETATSLRSKMLLDAASLSITEDDFSLLLKYKLMQETPASLVRYQDVSPSLAERIYHQLNAYTDFSSFVTLLKTKELTYTRISRALLHILLQIEKGQEFLPVPYARILGFRRDAAPLLSAIKKASQIPFVSKLASYPDCLSKEGCRLFEQEIWASNLYESVASHKGSLPFVHELEQQIVIV